MSGKGSSRTSPVAGARIISGLVPCNVIAEEILTDHPARYRAMLVESGNPAQSLADSPRMRDALLMVRNADASHTLFAILGIGLIGFAAYCFVEAAFRIVPRCAPPDLQTLATRARAALMR